jgi:glyoxylase I family protein
VTDDTRFHAGTVHHVSFRVTNLEVALEFYEGLLGCRRLNRPDDKMPVPGAWLEAGSTQVHLVVAPTTDLTGCPPTGLAGSANHIAFHVDDLDAACAALEERGFAVRRGVLLPQCFVQDPDGNLLEFTTL